VTGVVVGAQIGGFAEKHLVTDEKPAFEIVDDAARDPVKGRFGEIELEQRGLIDRTFFEAGYHPGLVAGSAVEAAVELIADAALGHGGEHRQRSRAGAWIGMSKQKLTERRTRGPTEGREPDLGVGLEDRSDREVSDGDRWGRNGLATEEARDAACADGGGTESTVGVERHSDGPAGRGGHQTRRELGTSLGVDTAEGLAGWVKAQIRQMARVVEELGVDGLGQMTEAVTDDEEGRARRAVLEGVPAEGGGSPPPETLTFTVRHAHTPDRSRLEYHAMRPALFAVPFLAAISSAVAAPKPPMVREIGALRTEDVPEIPRRVIDRARQYLSVRAADLLDWRPDGQSMLVGTRFGETAQVHEVRAPEGGPSDRQQRTFFTEPVREAAFAGDGTSLWFRMDTGGGEFYQYYALDQKTGEHRLLTDGKSRNEGLLPSPSRKQFAFTSTERNGKDYDVYVYSGGARKKIVDLTGQWNAIAWSPDEKHLILRHYLSISESTLHVLDVASGAIKKLGADLPKVAYGADAAVSAAGDVYFLSDGGGEFLRLCHTTLAGGAVDVLTADLKWDVTDLAMSADGKQLAWVVNEGGSSQLWLSSGFAGAKEVVKKARRLGMPGGVAGVIVGTPHFDAQSRRLGFTLSTGEIPADVFVIDVAPGKKPVRWTFSETGGLPVSKFVPAEKVEWKSFDGRALSGWLYRPRNISGKVPVVLNIHGGPESQSTAAFSSVVQSWVAELGVAVILPNVRGSAGYGRTSLSLDDGVKRMDSVKDIGALLDWIATQPQLDASKVAVYGGSYGGFMVLASLVAYSDRLRCGVDMVGISNFVTFLERTEAYRRDLRRAEYGDEREPAVRKVLMDASPLGHADRIRRPLFVAQGKNDPRVPVTEAEQIVKAVRAAGQQVWYMLASDEGHGFQKKPNRDAFQHAVLLFLEEHLVK